MRRYNKRRQAQEEAGLDLTPMMDIVFIMLTFFIVTTSFVKETGVDGISFDWENVKTNYMPFHGAIDFSD